MNICILGSKFEFEEQQLVKEAKKVFDKVVFAPISSVRIESTDKTRILYKKTDLIRFDCMIPRIEGNCAYYGYILCKLLENKIYLPIKAESILITHNKFLTLLMLDANKIPVPKTYLASSRNALNNTLYRIKYPIVMKLLYGTEGKGVMFADSKASAISMIDAMESLNKPLFIEEYLKSGKSDIRVLVVGNNVVASMKRKASHGDRRANIGIGGTGEYIQLPQQLQDLAIKSAQALGLQIAGIDIIKDKTHVVIEANVNVNFKGITQATGINVAKNIINYVKKEATAWRIRSREEKLQSKKIKLLFEKDKIAY